MQKLAAPSLADQVARIETFRGLHRPGQPFIFPTAWDAFSAMLFEQAGFKAVGTGSEGVAAVSFGLPDGEVMSFEDAVSSISRITASISLPLSADIESGYASTPEQLYTNVQSVIRTGIVGCNLEDAEHEGADDLRPIEIQTARLRAARAAADDMGLPIVITAVIDSYLTKWSPERKLADTVERAAAYHAAGADCVYAPGLKSAADVEALVGASGAVVNILAQPGMTYADLAAQGVARISFGSGLMRVAMEDTFAIASRLVTGDLDAYGERFVPWSKLVERLTGR